MTYATDQLYEEVAYVAYHLHWGLDEILELHAEHLHQSFGRDAGRLHVRRVEADAAVGELAHRGARGLLTLPADGPVGLDVGQVGPTQK